MLLQVHDTEAREWYAKEAAEQTWSVRTLQRNISSRYPEVMNIDQMCDALGGISTRTGYKLLKEGKIKSIKVGREYRIIKTYVTDFLLGKAQ